MNSISHQSIAETNLSTWKRKQLLRDVYTGFYRDIRTQLAENVSGLTVELGSGVCGIKDVIPECICTDTFNGPGIDRVESAYNLSFEPGSVANFIMFDVFHHLQYPAVALENLRVALAPKGRLIIFEPAVSLLGLLVYGLIHDEPLALRHDIDAREELAADEDEAYYAAQGNAHRIFFGNKYDTIYRNWMVITKRRYAAFSYIASGGYKSWQLYPCSFLPAAKVIDSLMGRLPMLFSTRLMVVLEN